MGHFYGATIVLNRLFSMVINIVFAHIIIVRGKLGLYHENNTSMSIIYE